MKANSALTESAIVRQQESLRKVIESISSELELRPLLTQIVQRACELLEADNGTIGLVDDAKKVVRTEAAFQMPPDELGAEMPEGVGVFGHVLKTGSHVVLERYAEAENPTQHGTLMDYTVIGLPIYWRGKLIGVFGLGSAPPRRFSETDVEALSLFAKHAAIAIENARLFERGQSLAVLEERHRLARELHDSVTQTLFSLNLIAQSVPLVWERDATEGRRRLSRLVELSGSALTEMRSLLRELRPSDDSRALPSSYVATSLEFIKVLGLPDAVRRHLHQLAAEGLECRLEADSYEHVSDSIDHVLFRVMQESLNNVVKHASASRVSVFLASKEGVTLLEVTDNGRGFQPMYREKRCSEGMGLRSMRDRVEGLGGTLTLDTVPEGGVRVRATIASKGELE